MIISQLHTCPHGCQRRDLHGLTHYCQSHGDIMQPAWAVLDHRGVRMGIVYGGSDHEALESARQSPEFNHLRSFTVRPA